MTANSTRTYIAVLSEIVDGINQYAGRTTKVAPNAIDEGNQAEVLKTLKKEWEKDYVDPTTEQQKAHVYPVGTLVRLVLKRVVFYKSYKPAFSEKIFKITKINYSSPVTYRLADSLTGKSLDGNFYRQQLSLVL